MIVNTSGLSGSEPGSTTHVALSSASCADASPLTGESLTLVTLTVIVRLGLTVSPSLTR